MIKRIEKNIRNKMSQIDSGELTPAKSNIGKQFTKLKDLDEPLWETLIQEYKEILQKK